MDQYCQYCPQYLSYTILLIIHNIFIIIIVVDPLVMVVIIILILIIIITIDVDVMLVQSVSCKQQ